MIIFDFTKSVQKKLNYIVARPCLHHVRRVFILQAIQIYLGLVQFLDLPATLPQSLLKLFDVDLLFGDLSLLVRFVSSLATGGSHCRRAFAWSIGRVLII